MFLGSFVHKPNRDGLRWFIETVFPAIKEGVGEVKLLVAGSNPTEEIMGFDGQDVLIKGYVADTGGLFQGSRVFVAPLRYGAGIKGKIVEAMSYGLPVVTTSIGAEGLGLKDGEDAMIADDPAEFAAKVLQLCTSPITWSKVSENSLRYVEANTSPDLARRHFAGILGINEEGGQPSESR